MRACTWARTCNCKHIQTSEMRAHGVVVAVVLKVEQVVVQQDDIMQINCMHTVLNLPRHQVAYVYIVFLLVGASRGLNNSGSP